jgi:FdrA protein
VSGASIALVSVPGPHAAAEAHQALSAGLHVFLFSDGVPLADEVRLKQRARARGLLVMGPECGTSILDGIGLGFANRVRRGPVGLVAASGTGLQEVTSLIHRLGSGVSQAIGTGGRDLHEGVGGLATIQALSWLSRDAETRVIGLLSKAPSAAVAARVLDAARSSGKPVVAYLPGWKGTPPAGVRVVTTLESAALALLEATGAQVRAFSRGGAARRRRAGAVRGLFTGGTLCEEARAIVAGRGHRFVDFGDAAYTRGRPHPIIDPTLRNAAVARAGAERTAGVVLVDVILGDGAHPDPAGALAAVVRQARRRRTALEVVAHVVGTDEDPQGLADQEGKLRKAGARVCPTSRLAAELARDLAGGARGR